jgi:hypothetical protein
MEARFTMYSFTGATKKPPHSHIKRCGPLGISNVEDVEVLAWLLYLEGV